MIIVDGKKWDKMEDSEKITYCDALLEDVRTAREVRDTEWYLNHMFKEGKHYLSYNRVTNQLEANPPRRRGEVRMVVNKVRSSTRAVQNYVTRSQPKWEIIPGDIDEETVTNARRLGKVMDYIYRRLHLESMVSGLVESGLDTSVGWVEVDWDAEAEKGMGQVRIRLHDSFDIFVDKRAYLYRGRVVGRFIAKTVPRSVDEVKNDERYDKKARKKVKSEDELATSRMKAKIVRRETGPDEKVLKRVIVKELMLWDDEKNTKGGNLQLFTYAGDQVLRDEPMKDREYPMFLFQISMNPLKIYQRAWTSDAIPLNKALDRTVSQKIMYVNQALIYRVLTEKGHGAGVVTNEMGEIIEINRGRNFTQMTMNPLPTGYDALSVELNTYIEDILGAHDAALGRLPSGARSGRTVEALQAADSNNLVGITQSLESFLSVLGEKILDIIADKYVASRIVKIAEPEEGQEFLKVVGEKGAKLEGAVTVSKDNEVIVKIGSWLGHTREAQRDTLLQLAELGVLDGSEILRQFEFPNVEELSRKAREQRMEQQEMDLAVAGRTAQGGEEGGDNMVVLADRENAEMMEGVSLPPTAGATPEHTQAHEDFVQTNLHASAPPEVQQIFAAHIEGELGGAGGVIG
jgi:hypothetical protein